MYEVKVESNISESWILAHVVPNIAKHYIRPCSLLLGKALLWRIMDPVQSKCLPTSMVERVHRLYHSMEGNILTINENPIAKIPLSVHGYMDIYIYITPLAVDEDEDDENEDGSPLTEEQKQLRRNRKYECDLSERKVRAMRSDNQQIEALTAHILHLRNKNKGKSVVVVVAVLSSLYHLFCCFDCCLNVDTEFLLLIDWSVYGQSIEVGYGISFYFGAIKRNKKQDESSHTLTICMYFSLFIY